ncbi:TetR/AcrR family transcriptional regulator [Nocardia asteroides]|uniref:TetR family transcriptional regulator n=2 Tax=Nocardia TaxID=1817 RepID=U5EED5_NOCAS|nr:TetR/AcrR family transcriptional regulator [Nocardia asteroides]TLF68809.1 TetR/AcrR family transcriptional regulator [Nocardia asteroides NBRC 15531]UGT48270.1 TetR family transcriptional regulator [Nocardia asteroides]SFL53957.1 transcriptional regulator, TetR family [Nocardia asteroides]VEG32615.1 transcriptional regulator BetI [Nocardia asteroides]GAD84756.1 putative TetR family transcriptional regulator [Nocardia asteroides NBRC 15531]
MRTNPERRQALLDAAIEVLATEGARGLTFRAVDKQAAVPVGTTSNYFASRDDLLTQAGTRFYEVVQPSEETMAQVSAGPKTVENIKELMKEVVARLESHRNAYLALLELRLEATRRPELREVLTERVRADLDFNVRNHLASGQPGDEASVLLLYLALNWLIVEHLTLPGIFTEQQSMELIETAVERAISA